MQIKELKTIDLKAKPFIKWDGDFFGKDILEWSP